MHCVDGNIVAWKSRRQSVGTPSAAESELVVAVDAHLRSRRVALLTPEINQSVLPFALACDNIVAFSIAGAKAQMMWYTWHDSIIKHLLRQALSLKHTVRATQLLRCTLVCVGYRCGMHGHRDGMSRRPHPKPCKCLQG